MKPKFMEAISDGDLLTIRLYLANELLLNPGGKSFSKMRSYAEMNVPNLYEVHNGPDFSEISTIFNDELLFNMRNDLDSNFSKERLDFFENVAQVVLKEKAQALKEEKRVISEVERQRIIESEENSPEEAPIRKKTLKERLKPFFKRKVQENIIIPFKEGMNEIDK